MPTGQIEDEPIILNLDEYEAIRLMDREGMSQQECSKRMGVARTTVQKIYEAARRKVADALVEGRPLKIQGGDFQLCEGNDCLEQECFKRCVHGCYCGKHCCHHKQI